MMKKIAHLEVVRLQSFNVNRTIFVSQKYGNAMVILTVWTDQTKRTVWPRHVL